MLRRNLSSNAHPLSRQIVASNWSPEAIRYDAQLSRQAFRNCSPPRPTLKNISYDLVDVARQTLANESRCCCRKLRRLSRKGIPSSLNIFTHRWLHPHGSSGHFWAHSRLHGGNLAQICAAVASTPDELGRLRFDARSLTDNLGRPQCERGSELADYGNKDWSGLTGTTTKLVAGLLQCAAGAASHRHRRAAPIDWLPSESDGTRHRPYTTVPTGRFEADRVANCTIFKGGKR